VVAFHLLARIFETQALDPVEGSSVATSLGRWAEMGIAEIGMSPSKPGMGEIKLSESSIQTIKTCDLKKTKKD
jgi:hypothetical protein